MSIRFQSVQQRMQTSLPSLPNESQTASRLKQQQSKTTAYAEKQISCAMWLQSRRRQTTAYAEKQIHVLCGYNLAESKQACLRP